MATQQIAQGLAGLGRNGDSTLVHMQPHEVAGLQAIAKSQGTSLTVNPDTGLPEAFSLGGFFESLAPTLAGLGVAMIPGMQPYALQAGIAAGAATGALTNKKNPLMGAVMGGMGGYGGANLANAASSFGSQAAKAGIDPSIAAIQTPGAMPSAATVAENTVGFQNAANLNAGLPIGGSASGAQAGIASQAAIPEATFGGNLSQAASNVGADPLGFVMANKGAVGMPLAGAVLGGLEPSDLGYNSLKPSTAGKYDPYATLNLNTNTGLKLYAQGGPVSFADGGMADPRDLPGGGASAMQGAGMLPLDVSDINAKYGYSPDADSQPSSGMGNMGMLGYGARQSMPSVQVPVLGLFADNDQIEAARSAYESQLAAAMSGRGGMGSTANAQQMGRSMANPTGGPMATRTTGIAGLSSMGSTAQTADTAPTAETALARLNLNKQYANGGSVQSGGLQDLYQTSDNPPMNPSLSQDGYGLGRLQAMADGGVAGYAEGGNVRNSYGGVGPNGITTYITGGPQHKAVINSLADTFGKNTDPSNEFGTLVRRIRDFNYPTLNSDVLQGGNINLNTASGLGMAKGGYLDGAGDGMSDSIPATIEGKQPARLADGEFVVSADVVSHLGNGSTKAGAKRLYGMMDKVRKARTGTKKQGKQINPNKFLPA